MAATLSGVTNERLIGPVVAAIAVGAVAAANLLIGDGENGGVVPFVVCAAVALGAAALLFGRIVPRAREGSAARTALVLALLSVVLLTAFWSGLPQVVAPAAIVLGLAAPRSGESRSAVAIGSLVYAASLVGAVIG